MTDLVEANIFLLYVEKNHKLKVPEKMFLYSNKFNFTEQEQKND